MSASILWYFYALFYFTAPLKKKVVLIECETNIDVDVDVWGQASQGVHIDVMVAELWCGWPSRRTGRGGGRSWRSSCKWNRIYSWLNRKW